MQHQTVTAMVVGVLRGGAVPNGHCYDSLESRESVNQ